MNAQWPMQQLVRYLADLGRAVTEGAETVDEGRVLRRGVIAAAEAVDAEIGLIVANGRVVTSVGLEADTTLSEELLETLVPVPAGPVVDLLGLGVHAVLTTELGPTESGHLVLARAGDEPFTAEEVALLRGLASAIVLSLRATRLILVERAAREQSERAAAEALVDPLTGLVNRSLFLDRLTHAVARARRRGTRMAVLFMDMDGFKNVNDTLGHAAGDELLIAFANRLRRTVRAQDTVARLGGDEFSVLVEDVVSDDEVMGVADRIREVLSRPVRVQHHTIRPMASIGIAFGPAEDDAHLLLRDADLAMYHAKTDRSAAYVVFEPEMHTALLERIKLIDDLTHAIASRELALAYQPVYDLATGQIVGLEALVRWRHPAFGFVPPSTFVPLAEDAGLIGALGSWVLDAACAQMANWRARYGSAVAVNLAVNLSSHQLRQPGLAAAVRSSLARAGLPAHRLVLEITETAILSEEAVVLEQLGDLGAIGVPLALDDFGTGYSSLSHLSRLPIAIVKIDRSFVANIDDDRIHALTNGIVRLARDLSLDVVAEGIETADQLDAVRGMRCAYGQGYLLAKPMSASEIDTLLAAQGDVVTAPADPQYAVCG